MQLDLLSNLQKQHGVVCRANLKETEAHHQIVYTCVNSSYISLQLRRMLL